MLFVHFDQLLLLFVPINLESNIYFLSLSLIFKRFTYNTEHDSIK